jgi:hypothetical protein
VAGGHLGLEAGQIKAAEIAAMPEGKDTTSASSKIASCVSTASQVG